MVKKIERNQVKLENVTTHFKDDTLAHRVQILGFRAWESWGFADSPAVVDGSRNIIIANFAQKVCWKVVCFQEKRKISPERSLGVNGKNGNFVS